MAIDRIGRIGQVGQHVGSAATTDDAVRGWRAIYVSPLKALVYDVERNLAAPLRGIELVASQLSLPFRHLSVDVRTGDTPPAERRRMNERPGDILVTTPESLFLIMTSDARRHLAQVETLIVDEIHAIAPTKRGAHTMLTIERLADMVAKARPEARFQRIGLSATVRPPEDVARFLSRAAVAIVNAAEPPKIDIEIVVPVDDMTKPWESLALEGPSELAPPGASGPLLGIGARDLTPQERTSLWPAIEPRILELIAAHHSTIVFVNSRGLAERLAERLNALAVEADLAKDDGPLLVRAHHGSIAHGQRREMEEALKGGQLRGIVATSSLELGIDMGAVDLVIQVESPDSAARGLQRIGRAGHQVGAVSVGKLFPKHRGDLVEATVIARLMREGKIESLTIPKNPLDVLAQQLVAMCATDSWRVSDALALVRRTANFADITDDVFIATLDMLTGRFPANEVADMRPRLNWNRADDTLTGRKGTRLLVAVNGGTIPDRGLYGVFLAGSDESHDGKKTRRVGELDEEMVHEARVGETFMLGASTWRIQEITRDRVLVTPAPGEPGKMPFWHGDGPGRPVETGRALGAFVRDIGEREDDDADRVLATHYPLDARARKNLIAYLKEQRAATEVLPSDRRIVVERFRDELGDWRVVILSPFGGRVHAPWALAMEHLLGQRSGQEVQALWTDDGIALRFVASEIDTGDGARAPTWENLSIDPMDLEDHLIERLGTSGLFSGIFRENAARALLLPRRSPQGRAPLWQQRLRAQTLLAAVRQHASFPIILETYRTCLQDIFDLPALKDLLEKIDRREVLVHEVETQGPSPFSRSIAFSYVAAYMYEYDNPVAERRAQALTLDKNLLRELLGHEELRDLFDQKVLDEVEAELQGLVAPWRATDADRLYDLLRRLGASGEDELQERFEGHLSHALTELRQTRRVVLMRIAERETWVAIEDAALYRDALGAVPPSGIPDVLLAPTLRPVEALVLRYAKCHGPFTAAEVARRLSLPLDVIDGALGVLRATGRVIDGAFRPAGHGREWCEPDVLRRIRRRMLAALRREVEPVDAATFARFLAEWQGIAEPAGASPTRIMEIIAQLEGMALPFSEWETRVLPARMKGYHARLLDELFALGQIVWVGRGSNGPKDGRVAFYRREAASAAAEVVAGEVPDTALHRAILGILEARGAVFLAEIVTRASAALAGTAQAEIVAALWDLVWAGLVTNDTIYPLRGLRRPGPTSAPKPGRFGLPARTPTLGGPSAAGRWSLVKDLAVSAGGRGGVTETRLGLVGALLERYGVIVKELVEAENVPGGFAALYEVLKSMEDTGRVRRGYVIDGLSGAQFALPGVVDRLRAAREHTPRTWVLAATDPAQPYGQVVPWPPSARADLAPRRQAGATVLLRHGSPLVWFGPKGTKLLTFQGLRDDDALAVEAFRIIATHVMMIVEIDGEPVRGSRWEPLFRAAGYVGDYKGMLPTGATITQ